MKHAGPATLAALAPLLARLRAEPALAERAPGCFYRGGRAFLHFHDDPAGPWADVRLQPSAAFDRVRVADAHEQAALAQAVAACLAGRR